MGRRLFGLALLIAFFVGPVNAEIDTLNLVASGTERAVDHEGKRLYLRAAIHPLRYAACTWMAGHHAVVWGEGKSAVCALFTVSTSDREVAALLKELGGEPGNNLTPATWRRRDEAEHPEPKKHVDGTPVDVEVWFPAWERPRPLASILKDPNGRGFAFRFGGHVHLIPEFESGCVVCLHSCPGGKVSNEEYTIRDFYEGDAAFALNDAALPETTDPAVIILTVRADEPTPTPDD